MCSLLEFVGVHYIYIHFCFVELVCKDLRFNKRKKKQIKILKKKKKEKNKKPPRIMRIKIYTDLLIEYKSRIERMRKILANTDETQLRNITTCMN